MGSVLRTFGRWGGVATIILLVITLLRQLIALVGFLMAAIKIVIVLAFAGLALLVVLSMLRGRASRRRDVEDI